MTRAKTREKRRVPADAQRGTEGRPERRKPGRPRDPGTDQAILRAALALFVEGGVDAASIDRVAQRAEVTRAAVYRRFSSRESMLVAALTAVRERAEQPLTAAPSDPDARSLESVLAWFVETAPRELAKPGARHLLAHLVGSVPVHPELMAAYWKATLGPRWTAFGELLAARRATSSSRHGGADTLADLVAGALLWRAVVRPGRRDARQLRRFLVEVLELVGLRPPSPRRSRAVRD